MRCGCLVSKRHLCICLSERRGRHAIGRQFVKIRSAMPRLRGDSGLLPVLRKPSSIVSVTGAL